MANAPRDENRKTALLGVSNADGVTPVVIWANPITHALFVEAVGGIGTVTSVSVVNANGFNGSVANATTTPAITLTTTITGILQGNGTAISAAGTTGSGNVVLQGTPTLTTPILGVATGTSLALGGATIGSYALAITGNAAISSYMDFTGITTPATPSAGISRLYAQLGVDGIARMSVKSPAGFDLTIFRDMVQRVFNNTVSTITKGSAVYVTGQSSGVPTIAPSKADVLATSDVTGILIADAAPSGFSTMQREGLVQGIDTSAFNLGDNLWLSDSVAGALQNTAPTKPSIVVPIGTVMVKNASTGQIFIDIINNPPSSLASLTDVTLGTLTTNDILAFNGSVWTNSPPFSAGASPGIIFYNSTPVINSVTQPGGLKQDGTAGNGIQVNSLSKTPVTTAEQTAAGQAVSDTRAFAAWLYNTALGRTTIDAGIWTFSTFCAVNSVAGGRVTTLTRNIYQVVPVSSGSVSTSGVGANSRTATITSSQFAGTFFSANATNTVASYLQTPAGIFQITAISDANHATITVPTGYVNESAVTFNVWNKLFGATTAAITAITPAYALSTFQTTQSAFTIASTDKLGGISFVTSNNTTTLTLTYDGTAHNTHFETPLITLHNNLAGLQGGTSNEYYHLTAAEYTGSGTGVFARVTSPVFTTPNIGSATGSVSGNAGTVTGLSVTAGKTLTISKTMTITSAGDSAVITLPNATVSFAAPGTSGNLMTSDGSNWVSSPPPAGLTFLQVQIMI